MSVTPVRLGVIGLGGFGLLHAQTIRGIGEAELVALVARRQSSIDAARQELPGVPGWTDLAAAIKESGAEAWVVASSTASHVPITRQLLDAGQTVLLEKPVADNLSEARSLGDRVSGDSHNLMLGHILLFNSEFRALQEQARERAPLVHLSATRHRPIQTLQALPGETPFHLTMVHDLYCALALLGEEDPVAYTAQVHHTPGGEMNLCLAQLRWESGCLGQFSAGFLTPAGMASDGFDRLEVYGQDWMARLQPNPRPIEVWSDRAHWPMALEIRADVSSPTGMMAEELRCFCRVVRGGEPVPSGATYHDALRVQQWLDRLERAAGAEA